MTQFRFPSLRWTIATLTLATVSVLSFSMPAAAQFETRAMQSLPNLAYGIAVGDFNRDGKMDIVAAGNELQVLLGNGDGTFSKPITYNVPGVSVAVADVNQDHILDLVVSNLETNSVSVLLGNGDGTFQNPIVSNTTGYVSALALGDFNNDGKPDLAVIDYPYISLLLGSGDGSFQAPFDNNTFVGAQQLAVGDFNKDHKLDVVVVGSNFLSSDFGILLGNGNGTLQDALISPMPWPPAEVAVADFNKDGNLDLAITAHLLGQVTVLLGSGDATFQPGEIYIAPVAGPIAIKDFDGDGNLDMVLGGGPPAEVAEFVGNGDGTFQAASLYQTGMTGIPVASDFNGDGKPDVPLLAFASGVTTVVDTGTLSFSPSAPVPFPHQLVNTVSTPQSVTVTNTGRSPVSISSLTWVGDFRVTSACGKSIPAGVNCQISVTFEPKKPGKLLGMITIVDSASSKPQIILLTGRCTPLQIVPSALKFASQKVGTISPPRTLTVTNESSVGVTFKSVGIGGENQGFRQTNTCGSSLAAGATCTFTITFTPTHTGVRTADLYLTLATYGLASQIRLTGTGI